GTAAGDQASEPGASGAAFLIVRAGRRVVKEESARPRAVGGPDGAGRRRSGGDDAGIGQVGVEGDPGEALEGLDVAGPRPRDDLGGERGPGRRLVPAGLLAEVAHELLVGGGLRATGHVLFGGAGARGRRGPGP